MSDDANCTPAVRREVIHRGTRFDYEQAVFVGTDGREVRREYIRHPGAVVILPVLAGVGGALDVVLIRNYRVALDRFVWELPAGTLGACEEPAACAGRELIEETGYRAATLDPLCRFHTSPGLSDELMWAFVARGLELVGRCPEADERMTVHPTPVEEVWNLIDRGEMMDCKSMTALLLARVRGLLGMVEGRAGIR